MLRFNVRRTLSMTLTAAQEAAGDARAWLKDEGPAGFAAHRDAVERTVTAVGERVRALLSAKNP